MADHTDAGPLFAAVHESVVGTFRTSRSCLVMSVHRGEAEIICSFRVFRILTHSGHRRQFRNTAMHHGIGPHFATRKSML